MAVITLLTDFGTSDEYVGIIKGVIIGIDPGAVIVDLTHRIDPQDTVAAAHMMRASYRFFPKGSIHLIVVDPGVGSDRLIIAAEYDGHIFIAPDNGIIPFIIEDGPAPVSIFSLANESLFLTPVSATFHGRDIFAAAGAFFSSGTPLEKAGPSVLPEQLKRLSHPAPSVSGNTLQGAIIWLDHFGNIITDIDAQMLNALIDENPGKRLVFVVGDQRIEGLGAWYGMVEANQPIALIGSRGFLEIAVNGGHAADRFMVRKGDVIRVEVLD